jgi:hypothetical protein
MRRFRIAITKSEIIVNSIHFLSLGMLEIRQAVVRIDRGGRIEILHHMMVPLT